MSKTRLPSLRSLRDWAASRRRGHLAGTTWSKVIDRDLDRVASDLLFLSQSAEAPAGSATQAARPSTKPIELNDRRGRVRQGGHAGVETRARAS
jgi:hypothetical protein